MDSAETQAEARRLVANAMCEAAAGRLDPRIHRALKRTIVIRTPLQGQRPQKA